MKKLYNFLVMITLLTSTLCGAEAGPANETEKDNKNEVVIDMVTGKITTIKNVQKKFQKTKSDYEKCNQSIEESKEFLQDVFSKNNMTTKNVYEKLNLFNIQKILSDPEYKYLVKTSKFALYGISLIIRYNNFQALKKSLSLQEENLIELSFGDMYQKFSIGDYFLALSIESILETNSKQSIQNIMYDKRKEQSYFPFIIRSKSFKEGTCEHTTFRNITQVIITNIMSKYDEEAQQLSTLYTHTLMRQIDTFSKKNPATGSLLSYLFQGIAMDIIDAISIDKIPEINMFYQQLSLINIPKHLNAFEDKNGKKWELPHDLLQPATPVKEVPKKDGKKPLATDERPLEELLAGLGIQKELPKKTITSHAKKQSKTTKKNKKKSTASSCAQAHSACEFSESSEDEFAITEEPLSKASEKEPALSGPLALKTRIVDWFINPDRALLKQGYIEGTSQAELFKYQLLKRYGKDAIIQNHRFPRALDTLILHDAAYCNIKQHPLKKNCYTLVSPGYIKQADETIQFGQYEYSFEKKPEGKRVIFHRFFRPMEQHEVLQRFTSQEGWKDIENVGTKVDLPDAIYFSDEDKALFADAKWQSEYEQEGWTIDHDRLKFCSLLTHSDSPIEYGIHTKQ